MHSSNDGKNKEGHTTEMHWVNIEFLQCNHPQRNRLFPCSLPKLSGRRHLHFEREVNCHHDISTKGNRISLWRCSLVAHANLPAFAFLCTHSWLRWMTCVLKPSPMLCRRNALSLFPVLPRLPTFTIAASNPNERRSSLRQFIKSSSIRCNALRSSVVRTCLTNSSDRGWLLQISTPASRPE